MRHRLPRLSLLTALLLMTMVGMAIVIVQLWRELEPLRLEVRRLRDEVGELSIDDDTKVHAIEVRTKEPRTWKFRIWVPQGEKVTVRARWGDVPQTGIPEAKAGTDLEEGEHWITYTVIQSPEDNSWGVLLESPHSGVGQEIAEKDRWWQWPEPAAILGEGVQNTTGVFSDEEDTFVLKRWRVADVPYADNFKKLETTTGFMIWLERQPAK